MRRTKTAALACILSAAMIAGATSASAQESRVGLLQQAIPSSPIASTAAITDDGGANVNATQSSTPSFGCRFFGRCESVSPNTVRLRAALFFLFLLFRFG